MDEPNRTLTDKFMLRFPDGMRARIKIRADKNNRSMNAEIVSTLELAYPAPADTMHLVIDDIRRVLDDYEKEKDPQRRMYLQHTVEGLAAGHMTIDWENE
jgi:plasmid stability protein